MKLREQLAGRIGSRQARVVVVGLGYVGLPLAVAAAEAGFKTAGIDTAPERAEAISQGRSPIDDVQSERLASITASTDYSAAAEADIAVITVPTPIDEYRVPDLSAVSASARGLAARMKPGSLVVLESTTYPGTTEEVVVPAFRERGFRPGEDLFVAYSPERIDPGNRTWTLTNTPKLVAGLDDDSLDLASAFYGTFVERLVPVSTLATAEIGKLFENIFRIVNIALVNEFQVICDRFGIDVWEVIAACSTKPYGYMPFYPGPGLGGHCVPVDPFYLAWKAREKNVNTEFIELAGRINAVMPQYVASKLSAILNRAGKPMRNANVGVIGVAYKKNSADARESPAIRLIELLDEAGALVSYHDPNVPSFEAGGRGLASQALTPAYVDAQDCLVVIADHDAIDWEVVRQARAVLDTRDVLRRTAAAGQGAAGRFG
jgi:nucleotide sugar dehydrogenase